MEIVLSLMLLALVYALFKTKHSEHPSTDNPLKYMPYAAAKIDACDFSCSAAFDSSGTMFLLRDAPALPLSKCDCSHKCKCSLIQYDDRRQTEDRRSGSQILQDVFEGIEKRIPKKRGRRWDD